MIWMIFLEGKATKTCMWQLQIVPQICAHACGLCKKLNNNGIHQAMLGALASDYSLSLIMVIGRFSKRMW